MIFEVTPDSLRSIQLKHTHDCNIKLAIIGYRSTTILAPFLVKSLYANGISVELHQAKYNQVELEIFNPASDLYTFQPTVVLIVNSLEGLRKQWFNNGANTADQALLDFERLKKTLFAHLPTTLLIHENYELDVDGVFETSNQKSFVAQIRKINALFAQEEETNSTVRLFDKATLLAYLGLKSSRNNGMLQTVDLPYTSNTEAQLSWELAKLIGACIGRIKKCLVLDLDNTLWGGIVGDDGVEGLQIGGTGNGMAFLAIQHWALELKKKGVLLTICSKNTLELAQEPFLKHPNMALSLSDISVFIANWANKAENIKQIKETLNIGYDSMVFVDDNPVERELVQCSFPEITVPNLPQDISDVPDYLRNLNLFTSFNTNRNDFDRTSFFAQNKARNEPRNETISLSDYLISLELKAKIAELTENNIGRVSELSMRSNQFNLCTRRYPIAELNQLKNDTRYAFQTVELEDKFGSYGLIAVLVLRHENEHILFIENWFMSCRAIQRGVEELMLNKLVAFSASKGIEKIVADYIPTAKNGVVAQHYKNMGFTSTDSHWELKVATYKVKPEVISII